MQQNTRVAAMLFCTAVYCPAAHLTQTAERAFDAYITNLKSRLAEQHAAPETYLAALDVNAPARTDREQQLRSGAVRIEPVNGGSWAISGGLMHHWRAAAFVPAADANQMLALLRDPSHLSRYYAPQVVSSRALSGRG